MYTVQKYEHVCHTVVTHIVVTDEAVADSTVPDDAVAVVLLMWCCCQ